MPVSTARYAAGVAIVTNYEGPLPAAQLHSSAAEGSVVGVVPAGVERPSTRPLLRTTLLFLLLWVPSATLDDLTTEIARRQGDWVELHPLGFRPLSALVRQEMILTLAAMVAVVVGAWFCRDALDTAVAKSLDHFCEALFQKRAWALPFIGIPLFVAIGRYVVVISNVCYLTMDWSPIDAVLLHPLESLFGDDALAYVVSILIGVVVLWYPVTALIFRLLHAVNGGRRQAEPDAAADGGGM